LETTASACEREGDGGRVGSRTRYGVDGVVAVGDACSTRWRGRREDVFWRMSSACSHATACG